MLIEVIFLVLKNLIIFKLTKRCRRNKVYYFYY